MLLEDRALEVLNCVRFTVQVRYFGELIADWEALLRQAAVLLPVLQKSSAKGLTGLSEGLAITSRLGQSLKMR
jgi:hypothetical protein